MKNPEGRHNVSAVVSSEAYRHLTQLCWEKRLTMSKAINKLLEEDADRQAFFQKALEGLPVSGGTDTLKEDATSSP